MTYASALFVSLTFVVLARRLGLVTRPLEVVATSRQAYRVLTDATLDDDAKEAIMQQSAKALARQFVFICAASLAAAAVPLGVVWLLASVGLVSLKAVGMELFSWQVLLSGTLLVSAGTYYGRVRVLGTH